MLIALVSQITYTHKKKLRRHQKQASTIKNRACSSAKVKGNYPQLLNVPTSICSDGLIMKTSKPTESYLSV